MEWIILMIAGLLLDISAVYMILKKNLIRKIFGPAIGGRLPEDISMDEFNNLDEEEQDKIYQKFYNQSYMRFLTRSFDDDIEIKSWTKWGLSFLMIGFILQLIANMMNYLTSK